MEHESTEDRVNRKLRLRKDRKEAEERQAKDR